MIDRWADRSPKATRAPGRGVARRRRFAAFGRLACWLVVFASLSSFASGAAQAQKAYWNPPASLGHGQLAKLELVFEGCSPDGPISLPDIQGVTFIGEPTESRIFSMVNFQSRTQLTLGYNVRVQHAGPIELPSFEVDTNEGPMVVAAARVEVTAQQLPGPMGEQQPLSEIAGALLDIDDREPWAGEVVHLTFDVGVDARRHANLAGPLVWDAEPMIVEPWSDPIQMRPQNGRNGVRIRTRGIFTEPGRVALSQASQDLNIETSQGRGGLFRNRRMRTVTVTSDPGTVRVRALPPDAPQGFAGAVGQYTLTSKLAPERAQVGEPLTWTLTLRGVGNWPGGVGLPPRSVPNDVEVIRPRSVRKFDEGSIFEGSVSEDLVLIPTRPGTLRLEPVEFSFFEPSTGRYETLRVAPPSVEILPVAAAPRVPAATTAPAPAASTTPSEQGGPTTGAPEPDVGLLPGERAEPRLPRDPVPGEAVSDRLVAAPFSPASWVLGLFAMSLPALACIAWLGRRRAASVDRLAGRRAARAQLKLLLAAADDASSPVPTSTLLEWQRLGAAVLGLAGRAPTERRLDAIGWGETPGDVSGVDAEAWRALWREADAAIHRSDAEAPADWVQRARRALEATQLRAVPPFAGLRPAHVWPSAALFCLAITIWAGPVEAERTGLEAYRAGDFAAAAEAMERRVEAAPLDWKARSDLGLALLQLGSHDAALAETSAAFALAPYDEHLRWNLAVVSRRAGWIDPALRDLAWGGGAHALARRLPVAAWQVAGWAAAAAFWGSIAAAVALRHARRSPRGAFVVAGASVLCVALCAAMVATWSDLGDRGAALVRTATAVRSLPTELVDDQVAVALEAGRVVVAEHAFLGWVHVRLANGDLGWVRAEALSPVYERRADLVSAGARFSAP